MAAAIAKTPVRNNSEETVVVIVLTKVKEDIEAAKPLLVRMLKPGKWFSFQRREREDRDEEEEEEEQECHGYICLDSQAFRVNTWVSFDAAAVWAARSAEIRADETGALQLLPHPTDPLHKKLNEKVNLKNPFKYVTSIISEVKKDVTIVITDRAEEEGEACSLVFVRNVSGGSKSELNVKKVFGDNLERVNEVHAYLTLTSQLFKRDKWLPVPAKKLTDGDFIIFRARPVRAMITYRSKKRSRVAKSRGFTWARANFTA